MLAHLTDDRQIRSIIDRCWCQWLGAEMAALRRGSLHAGDCRKRLQNIEWGNDFSKNRAHKVPIKGEGKGPSGTSGQHDSFSGSCNRYLLTNQVL